MKLPPLAAPTLVFLAASAALHAQIPKTGLKLWLRADAGVTTASDGRVNAWKDQSGRGVLFTQTGAMRPLLAKEATGAAHLRFDGKEWLLGKLGVDLKRATIFALVRYRVMESDNDYVYMLGLRGRSGSQICLSRLSRNRAYHYDGASQHIGPGTIPSGPWGVMTQVVGKGSAKNHVLSRDGKTLITSSSSTDYNASGTRSEIGSWYGSFNLRGDLRELIVYDRVVSGSERTTVEAWLAKRRGGAAVLSMGRGCPGTGGRPTLAPRAASLPKLGGTFAVDLTSLPKRANSIAIFALSFDDTSYARIPLPLDLSGAGLTGCVLRVSLDVLNPAVTSTGTAQWSIGIPNDKALEFALFHLQALSVDRPANAIGLTFSNSLSMTIGR